MNRAQAVKRLAALGYEFDWSVTGPSDGAWCGTIDAIGRNCVDGDCRGEAVYGENAADMYRTAVNAMKGYHPPTPCPYEPGECPFHDDA